MDTPLETAIKIIGSQSELARLLGVKQPTVFHWLNKAPSGVPAQYCPRIELFTNGTVTKEQLRPDVFQIPTPQPRRRKP